MKKLFMMFAFIILCSTSVLAEHWLVFIFRGDEVTVLIMDQKPFPGEGVVILGPFPKVSDDVNVNATSIQVKEAIKLPSIPSSNISNPDDATAYLTYKTKNNKLSIISIAPDSNWDELLAYLKKNGGCTPDGFGIAFSDTPKPDLLSLNGKPVNIKSAKVTFKYGDILIGGLPISDFED